MNSQPYLGVEQGKIVAFFFVGKKRVIVFPRLVILRTILWKKKIAYNFLPELCGLSLLGNSSLHH
uniref:Uncharacterized protein n=1 Tax=Nelumbo nucifera TaxID=4432 RepID=A0A822YVG4_NELNU|nr:TPA_asm: hypothetical protein HUJ06_008705 [Nelumbo nucifera]